MTLPKLGASEVSSPPTSEVVVGIVMVGLSVSSVPVLEGATVDGNGDWAGSGSGSAIVAFGVGATDGARVVTTGISSNVALSTGDEVGCGRVRLTRRGGVNCCCC